jgi:hypothetical protein
MADLRTPQRRRSCSGYGEPGPSSARSRRWHSSERKEKDYAPSSTSESEHESEAADSEAETLASDTRDDAENKAAAFESQAVELLERTCSHSPN